MQKQITSYAFVPLKKDSGLESTMRTEVFPLVDTSPTRGGQITMQALLRHEDGRYQWLIGYETSGGNWHESHIAPAQARLETLTTIYAMRSMQLLSSATRQVFTDESFHKDFPVGMPFTIARAYRIVPKANSNPEAFERSMVELVLPAVRLHHGNRLGHTTDTLMLFREDEQLQDGARYQLWISRSLHKQFEDRDSFRNDVQAALEQLEGLGSIYGFEDQQIIFSVDLSES